MLIDVINIGNSKGFRVPASILKHFEDSKSFDLTIEDDSIILKPSAKKRVGWAESFLNNNIKPNNSKSSKKTKVAPPILDPQEEEEWQW
jgi:antitoxin MazE